jgi:hypothetical protein
MLTRATLEETSEIPGIVDGSECQYVLSATRAALGVEAFDCAYTEGPTMPLNVAVANAIDEQGCGMGDALSHGDRSRTRSEMGRSGSR